VQDRLDLSVDQEPVPQDAVQIEQVEEDLASARVDHLVVEHHGDVVLREARQMETRQLVTGILIVEEQIHPRQALVGVLGGVVDAVVVVPERVQRFLMSPTPGCVELIPARTFG
jgi:hypothetical protein